MRQVIESILREMFSLIKYDINQGVRSYNLKKDFLKERLSFRDWFAYGVVETTCAAVQAVRQAMEHVHYSVAEYREFIYPAVESFVAQLNQNRNIDIPDTSLLAAKLCSEEVPQKRKTLSVFSNGNKVRLKKDHYTRIDDDSTRIPAGASGVIEGYGPHYAMMRMSEKYPFLPDNCIVWQDEDGTLAEQLSADIEHVN